MYMITVSEILLIVLAISSDSHLHTPSQPVLLLQRVLCRFLFHLHHDPKDDAEHPDTQQSYNP